MNKKLELETIKVNLEEIINMKSISGIACIDSCNGMCRRVLEDIKKAFTNPQDLIEAYNNDKYHGGRDYKYIIKLGELLKEISK